MEKSHEYKIELNELFIDFRQAFDTVYRSQMIETLKLMEIPNKLIRLIKMTMQNTRAVVETERGRSEKFGINTGGGGGGAGGGGPKSHINNSAIYFQLYETIILQLKFLNWFPKLLLSWFKTTN
jgi:hypothetical protein